MVSLGFYFFVVLRTSSEDPRQRLPEASTGPRRSLEASGSPWTPKEEERRPRSSILDPPRSVGASVPQRHRGSGAGARPNELPPLARAYEKRGRPGRGEEDEVGRGRGRTRETRQNGGPRHPAAPFFSMRRPPEVWTASPGPASRPEPFLDGPGGHGPPEAESCQALAAQFFRGAGSLGRRRRREIGETSTKHQKCLGTSGSL